MTEGNQQRVMAAAAAAGLLLLSGCASDPYKDSLRPTVEDRAKTPEPPPAGTVAVLMRIGEATRRAGNPEGAIPFFRRAHAADIFKPEPLIQLGLALNDVGAYNEAAEAFREALKNDPHSADAMRGFGVTLIALDQPALAIDQLNAAVAIEPNAGTYNALGVAYDHLGDYASAQKAYNEGLTLAPNSQRLLNNLGLSLALAGDLDKAIETLLRAALDPGASPRLRQNLALVYGLAGRDADAARVARTDLSDGEVQRNLAYYGMLRHADKDTVRPAGLGLLEEGVPGEGGHHHHRRLGLGGHVRRALRLRLVRQLLTEGLLLSAFATGGGLLLTHWCRHALVLFFPRTAIVPYLPGEIDWRVLVLSAVVCVLATILFGVAPASQASKLDLASALKTEMGGVVSSQSRSWPRSSLVLVQVALSFVLLVGGAELLVRGAAGLAIALGISPLVVGLTVVAFGTSAPELAVSTLAAWHGQAGLALGSVVGSNICNILLILGLSALAAPLTVARQVVRLEVPIMIGVSVLLYLFALGGSIGRIEGFFLFAGVIAYTAWTVRRSRRENRPAAEEGAEAPHASRGMQLLQIAGGLALLGLGSKWLVDGAVAAARYFGVSDLVIGLTVVALGTSLPELATSVLASLRGQRDIAVGNIVGSNIFNILCVLGLTAVVAPAGVPVPASALRFDLPVMLAATVACLPIFFTGHRIDRWEGGLFFGYYLIYVIFTVLAARAYPGISLIGDAILWFVLPLTFVTLVVSVWHSLRRRGPVDPF